MSKIGKNIKKIRTVKKINQSDFANLFSISRASIGAYEEGRAEPKIDTIIKISEHYNIAVDKLLKKDIQVNDIINFKLNNPAINLSQHNITRGKKVMIKEVELKSKPNSNRKTKDLISVPVNHTKSEYIAILTENISICRRSSRLKEEVDRPLFIELENEYIKAQLEINNDHIKIKGTGELIPKESRIWVIESKIISANNSNNNSLEERISRLEKEIYGQ